jgi:NTP pyrophosphatase (non-canonical NTP hydrolase)
MEHKSSGVLVQLEQQALEDSERWFPNMQGNGLLHHHALALCGEAGEFANVVKKIQRGSLDPADAKVQWMLRKELTDVFVYLLNLSGLLGMDLEATNAIVRVDNERRFGANAGTDNTHQGG